jgi:hypothetical protein
MILVRFIALCLRVADSINKFVSGNVFMLMSMLTQLFRPAAKLVLKVIAKNFKCVGRPKQLPAKTLKITWLIGLQNIEVADIADECMTYFIFDSHQ